MMKLFLTMASVFLAAAVEDLSYFSLLDNDHTENVTETDFPKEFTTILPDLPNVNSCIYPGTCPSLNDNKHCQKCQLGYVKDPEDDTKCKYANEDENAFLLTSSSHDIRLLSLDTKNSTPIMQNCKFPRNQGVGYIFRANKIFWLSDTDKNETIYTAPLLNYVDSEKKIVMQDKSVQIRGIAVDWIYNHIYLFNARNYEFIVINLNGTMKKVLFIEERSSPATIVVNPLSGWMYWADWSTASIFRVGLDGSQKKVVHDRDIRYPTALALDFVENRLYWSQLDIHEDGSASIFSSKVDGSDRKYVFTAHSQLSPNYVPQIVLFNQSIYWQDWFSHVIYKVNKCNGQELQMIYNSTSFIRDLMMYHSSMQPEGKNLCSERIPRCSHFCFPAPSSGIDGSVTTTTCACPDGLYLFSDQRTCMSQINMLFEQ